MSVLRRHDGPRAVASLALHWPEYLMEVAELGLYMFFICAFAALMHYGFTLLLRR